jgi:hypothetical protein
MNAPLHQTTLRRTLHTPVLLLHSLLMRPDIPSPHNDSEQRDRDAAQRTPAEDHTRVETEMVLGVEQDRSDSLGIVTTSKSRLA